MVSAFGRNLDVGTFWKIDVTIVILFELKRIE